MASDKPIPALPNIVVKQTAKLIWTIDGFPQVLPKLRLQNRSPKFSPPDSDDEFVLWKYFFVSDLTAYFMLIYNGPSKSGYFRYRISILDTNGEKHHTQEYIWNCTESVHSRSSKFLPREECTVFLRNGSLKIYCEVDILGEDSQIESFDKLSQNYETLLESGKFSDFTVQIGEKQFRVHKNILASRSAVFAAMFEHDDTKEVKEGRVVVEDVSADVFELLIRYIYTGKVNNLGEHADELFVAADKYQLDHLKSVCEQLLISCLTIDSVCGILFVSDMHNAAQLKSKCIEYIVKHSKEVMQTAGWKQLAKANRADLLVELFEKLAISIKD